MQYPQLLLAMCFQYLSYSATMIVAFTPQQRFIIDEIYNQIKLE